MQNSFSLHDIAGRSQTLCTDSLFAWLSSKLGLELGAPGVSGHCFASRALGLAVHGWAKHFPKQSTSPAGPPAMWKAVGTCYICPSSQTLGLFLSAFPGQG